MTIPSYRGILWQYRTILLFLVLPNTILIENQKSTVISSHQMISSVCIFVAYHIYPKRSPGVYFLYMISDLGFKRIWRLFRPQCLFPIVDLSRVERKVPVTLFISSMAWLEANMFIKVYGLHSLTKHVNRTMQEDSYSCDNYDINNQKHFQKEDAHVKRYREYAQFLYIWARMAPSQHLLNLAPGT